MLRFKLNRVSKKAPGIYSHNIDVIFMEYPELKTRVKYKLSYMACMSSYHEIKYGH